MSDSSSSDSKILSGFASSSHAVLPASAEPRRVAPNPFDTCHPGVVLRAVLGVEAVTAVAAGFASASLHEWALRLAFWSVGAFPAVILWLGTVCALKSPLARWTPVMQTAFALAAGILAGLYGGAMLKWAGIATTPSWWAWAGAGFLGAALLLAGLRMRAVARAPADSAARLAHLQARIRPHFLFNSLNTAIALVREDPLRAERVLEDLAELFRYALAQDSGEPGAAVSLADEVELARRYLEIEQLRFGERLSVSWDLDPRASQARVPPLCLQPLVENAVRHGVEPSIEGATVRIATERRRGSVVVKISNTVPAGQGPAGHGVAQHNVAERLRLLHDVQCRFDASYRAGVYLVRMEVPA